MRFNLISYAQEEGGIQCCGIDELTGIADCSAEEAALDVLTTSYGSGVDLDVPPRAHLIFTQARSDKKTIGYGYKLAEYILNNKLGTLAVSDPARNPNSDNYVTIFIWTLDRKGIQAWFNKNRKRFDALEDVDEDY